MQITVKHFELLQLLKRKEGQWLRLVDVDFVNSLVAHG